MSSLSDAASFVERFAAGMPSGRTGLFNPWADHCAWDAAGNGPEARKQRLARHLSGEKDLVLVGEAPSWRGARYSGIAFTSERQLQEGVVPGFGPNKGRITSYPSRLAEPSAAIVWGFLTDHRITERVVLWNAVQLHPHSPEAIQNNRPPKTSELEFGRPGLAGLLELHPRCRLVAVGQNAIKLMAMMNVKPDWVVRHPARGGANLFRCGLASALADMRR